mmetsp:Transcript_7598/g.18601  ORF Transcript_7598/g.18601 Transcript_7598/m.18601 type:complete len:366 (-) Transcript_7598:215-1312(-)
MSGSQKQGKRTTLILLGVVFILVIHIATESKYFDGLSYTVSESEHRIAVISESNGVMEKSERYSKYFQNYRYIPPATRYEDISPLPARNCGIGPEFDAWWGLTLKERSRLDEDRFIYETFFKDLGPDFKGTYLELGAYDGVQESNSRFFDDCLGWKGLLLEGNPIVFRKTIENRPYAHKMSMAPSCSAEYEQVNKTIQFYRQKWTNGGLVGHAKAFEGRPTVDVPCAPLQPILEDMFLDEANRTVGDFGPSDLPTLDFFSLDVEGSEPLVLSTIDFEKVRINIMIIEIFNAFCKTDDCEVRRDIRAKMQAEGFKRYEGLVSHSDLYVHPESPFQVPDWLLANKQYSKRGGSIIIPKEIRRNYTTS